MTKILMQNDEVFVDLAEDSWRHVRKEYQNKTFGRKV